MIKGIDHSGKELGVERKKSDMQGTPTLTIVKNTCQKEDREDGRGARG